MERDEIMRRAEVAASHAEGAEVQVINPNSCDCRIWTTYTGKTEEADWFNPNMKWRKKPKPNECWGLFHVHGGAPLDTRPDWETREELPMVREGQQWVRMREIDE